MGVRLGAYELTLWFLSKYFGQPGILQLGQFHAPERVATSYLLWN